MKRRNRISSIRKAALRKLRSRAGESISETMVSVLIAALSLVMLAGAVTSASNSIAKSKEKLNAYYDVNEMLVQKSVSNSGNTPTAVKYDAAATVKMDGSPWASKPVKCYENRTFSTDLVIVYYTE